MALNFPAAATAHISLGNLASAKFPQLSAWTCLAFFRVENTALDERSVVTKTNQFLIRTDNVAAPSPLQIYSAAYTLVITGGNNVALNTWYLVAVTSDSSGNMKLYLVDMAGTFLDDGVTGTQTADVGGGNPGTVYVGVREGINDPMDGDIDFPCYISAVLTKEEILAYLHNPIRTAMRHKSSGVTFLLKLGSGAVNSVDWSGSGNPGTINGSPTVSNSPPTGPLFGFDPEWAGSFTAAAGGGGLSIPIAAYHYNHHLGSMT